ncbi:MAG: FixH family protein [Rubrimonas sp.]|uniref:FixH family protein n=1 Tax=Rubrimonas sp. TaxID=2036015 RepID=UPI002FDE4595
MAKRDSSTDYRPGGAPFTGRKFLMVMLGFFGVIIAVNGLMAYLAVNNFRGVVVKSSFVASQDFNRDLARFAEQEARGWAVEAELEGARPRIRLADADGAPLTGLAVTVTAMRNIDQREDRTLSLRETAPGVYEAGQDLAPGQWTLQLVIDGAGPRYATSRPIFVSRDG